MLRTWRIIAISLLIFNGISALLGGYKLMADPTGSSMSSKLEWLRYTPFSDYYLPGLLLFVCIGLCSMVIALFVFMKIRQYPQAVILQGLILFIWLVIEMLLLQLYHFLYIIYGFVSVMLIISGSLLYRFTTVGNEDPDRHKQ